MREGGNCGCPAVVEVVVVVYGGGVVEKEGGELWLSTVTVLPP